MSENHESGHDRRRTVRTRWGTAVDVGRSRATNEDSVLVEHPLFLVADGMGGHDAGEVASALAVEEFRVLAGRESLEIADLAAALTRASRRIAALAQDGGRNAGTTVALTAITIVDGTAYWAVMNLGDSRVYRLTDDYFEQVSVDHSVVQELVERGEIPAAAARHHPYRNMVTRALGAGGESDADYWLIPVEPGDRMLVCSDGLTTEVEDDDIGRILRDTDDPQRAAERLVAAALDAGGRDNVSVVVVDALTAGGARVREDTERRTAHETSEDSVADGFGDDTRPYPARGRP